MDIKASVKHVKISPRKARLVVDLIRGLQVEKALAQLKFLNKGATDTVSDLVSSAIANALHNYDLKKENLFVKEIRVDEGATLKRWMPRAHGRATPIRKRVSHIKLVLGEIKDSGVVESKKQKVEKPVNLEEMVKQAEKQDTKKDKDVKPEISSKENSKTAAKKGFTSKFFQRKSG